MAGCLSYSWLLCTSIKQIILTFYFINDLRITSLSIHINRLTILYLYIWAQNIGHIISLLYVENVWEASLCYPLSYGYAKTMLWFMCSWFPSSLGCTPICIVPIQRNECIINYVWDKLPATWRIQILWNNFEKSTRTNVPTKQIRKMTIFVFVKMKCREKGNVLSVLGGALIHESP